MPQGATLRVRGYTELLRACKGAERDSRLAVRATFRKVGDVVKRDTAGALVEISPKTAAGVRTVVRQRGVSVEQSLRKTTRQHPEFGPFQMREAFVPALVSNEAYVGREMERALDRVCDIFERRGAH